MQTPNNNWLNRPPLASESTSENHSSFGSHYSLYRRMLFSALMVLLSMSLTQCSKDDGPDPTLTPTGIAISGIVQAPTGTTTKSDASGPAGINAKLEASAGETPLPNTKVDLYHLGDYFSNPAAAEPLATITSRVEPSGIKFLTYPLFNPYVRFSRIRLS
jgi:hypothetical protein